MKTIYKYELESGKPIQEIEAPERAEFLSVQIQRGVPCIWAIVENDRPTKKHIIVTRGTGFGIPDEEWEKEFYIGTYQEKDGYLVWHVFERKS